MALARFAVRGATDDPTEVHRGDAPEGFSGDGELLDARPHQFPPPPHRSRVWTTLQSGPWVKEGGLHASASVPPPRTWPARDASAILRRVSRASASFVE